MKNKVLIISILILAAIVIALSACTEPSGGGGEDTLGSFDYNNHSYQIIKTPSTWFTAKIAAIAAGGYLVHIDSASENAKIYAELVEYVKISEFSNTVATDGGKASYVWTGANDIAKEGTWKWTNDKLEFWKGSKTGSAVSGQYNNWGTRNGQQYEPDNYKHQGKDQDGAGIALTQWPKNNGVLGIASQWNDIDIENKLFYIIEFDQIKN